jgi:two-component system NtrC family sensor kinase
MKVGRKFTLWIISFLSVIGLVSAYFYYRSEMSDGAMRIESLARTVGPILEQSLEDYMLKRDSHALERTFDNLKNIEPIRRIWLVNREWDIKVSSDKRETGRALSPDDPGCRECHEKGHKGFSLLSSGTFRWAQPVTNKPECYKCHGPLAKYNGVFIIDFSTGEISRRVAKHMRRGFLILLLSLACVGFALIVFSKKVMIKRLDRVTKTIIGFQEGSENIRIPVKGNDEIADLETSFNRMADAITERDSERKLLYNQVSSSYEQWQRTFDSITELISIVDREGNIVKANQALMNYFGVSQEELQDKKYFDLFRGQDMVGGSGPNQGRTMDISHPMEEIVDKEGRTFTLSVFPFAYPETDFKGAILVARDITERKGLEEERERLISELKNTLSKVSRSQEMWQDTFDAIGDLISIHDSNFNILKVNRSFADYFGIHPRDAIGKKCYEFFHAENPDLPDCPHRITLNERRPATAEQYNPKTSRIFRVSTFPFTIPESETGGSIHIARDITDEKDKETRLIMSERLAALGQMASGVAHEINNPLAAILGCAEGLLARIGKGQFDKELFENYLKIIEEEISRCKSITTSMLSFVRKTTYEKKAIDVREEIERTLEIIGFQGRLKNVKLIKNYSPDVPLIYGNPGELRQALIAIVTNALDAMRDEGVLTVDTGKEGEKVFLKISDSGPGIPREIVDKIFDPFFTTKSESGGTGLGLSIANKIINNHNGSIKVSSAMGVGTTFTIFLPVGTV